MSLVYLVRHGDTTWTETGRLQGQADIPLSAAGRAQAAALRPQLAGIRFRRVVASDLARAYETAALAISAPITLEPGLREIGVGVWEGAEIATLMALHGKRYAAWRCGAYTPAGGEPWRAFCERAAGALERHLDPRIGPNLIFAHGGVIRATLETQLGLEPKRFGPLCPAAAAILRTSPRPTLVAFNAFASELVHHPPD